MADTDVKRMAAYARWLLAVLLLAVAAGCGEDAPPPGGGNRLADTFTFFGVDANSTAGDALRGTLRGHLGREAVAGKDVLDLRVFSPIDLERVFPELDDLNRRLNPDLRARKEHAITSLAYRYPQKHYPSFTYVRLVFSAHNRHPLLIVIDADDTAQGIPKTLSDKYGPPLVTRLAEPDTTFWSWEKRGDRLIVQKRRNKFDRPEYVIAIFYVARIQELLDAEAAAAKGNGQEKSAF